MAKLNRDILYLISKEFHNDNRTIYSCLLVNKTWCEVIVPILWKNPWKYVYSEHKKRLRKLLVDVIISHLSDEKINKLKNLGYHFSNYLYRKPLFDYVSFCKHLNLVEIKKILRIIKMDFILNEIIGIFINVNTKITHLYIPKQFNYQLHLIPGAKSCFSNIIFLSCDTNISDKILNGLTEICKSINELELVINEKDNNYEITKLIGLPKKLINVRLLTNYVDKVHDDSFWEVLENSFIKHANTVQHFKINRQPITKILTYFINLKRLDLSADYNCKRWDGFKNVSLPFLQILRVRGVLATHLANLIKKDTNENLIEFTFHSRGSNGNNGNKLIIQSVYKNFPNLKYFKFSLRNDSILELEKLLINCQYLNGLYILCTRLFDWDNLFQILAKSSPNSLYKFIFCFHRSQVKLESLRLFFDNWKGRHPMILQFIQITHFSVGHNNLIEKYKAEGVIKKFSISSKI
jgi:hypothetical protein